MARLLPFVGGPRPAVVRCRGSWVPSDACCCWIRALNKHPKLESVEPRRGQHGEAFSIGGETSGPAEVTAAMLIRLGLDRPLNDYFFPGPDNFF